MVDHSSLSRYSACFAVLRCFPGVARPMIPQALWRDTLYFMRHQSRDLFYLSFWIALLTVSLAWVLRKLLPIDSLAGQLPFPVIWLIPLLLHEIISPLLDAALLRFLHQRSSHQAITAQEAFKEGLAYYPALILLESITSTVITGGLVLFLLPGLVIAIRWALAPCILVRGSCSVWESLQQSWRHTATCWPAVLVGYLMVLAIHLLLSLLLATVGQFLPADLWSWSLISNTLLNLTRGSLLIYCFRLTLQLLEHERSQ